MAIIQGNAKGGVTSFYPKELTGSLRFNDDDSAYLSWTPASAGNRKTWTWSGWFKITDTSTSSRALFSAGTGTTDATFGQILLANDSTIRVNGYSTTWRGTTAKLRDPSAWYHLVVAFDTTQSTEADRVKVYINGVEQTAFDYNNNPTQDANYAINQAAVHYIGRVDSGIGTNYLNEYLAEVFFIDGTAHDADAFGETKNGVWVPKNITATDFTMGTNGFHLTFEDDTTVEAFNTVLYDSQQSSLGVTGVGFSPDLVWVKTRSIASGSTLMDSVRGASAMLGSATTAAESTSGGKGIISFDSDGFTLGLDADIGSSNYSNGTDYVAWCWDAGANNASTGHSSVTYTGTGTAGLTIKGFGFDPDLIWTKARSGTYSTRDHALYDSVRGANKYLESSTTDVEASTTGASFVKDGYKLGDVYHSNGPSTEYVAWAWDAGDSDPVSNTDGSITSTVKSNGDFSIISYVGTQTAGDEIGHSLNAAPDFFIVKNREDTSSWIVWHKDLSANQWCKLETTDSVFTNADAFGAVPSSTTITLGTFRSTNGTGEDIICYAWRNVTGKQKFGTYDGDATTDGSNEVTTGFRVGWLMVKRTDSTGFWVITDATRDPFNDVSQRLYADDTSQEDTATSFEFTDTGFKIKTSAGSINANGGTYIYAAFAGSYPDFITDYNTDGTLDSRTKASDTNGFSIVSYQGDGTASRTVGHGLTLSSAPTDYMVIVKSRTVVADWQVWHSGDSGVRLKLNTTDADFGNYPITFGTDTITLPSINSASWDSSGHDYIAYCWTATTGVSAFGSYAGDSTTDGSKAINVGFKPAMVIIKHAEDTAGSYSGDWYMYDNTRDVPNGDSYLRSNLSSAETANGGLLKLTDNGFALYTSSGSHNETNNNYIYAAFADTREAAFWLDQSGNDNDWQPVNLDHNDTLLDSPTNNFATLNPLDKTGGTFADGNLRYTHNTTTWVATRATMGISSGKMYFEVTLNNGWNYAHIGVHGDSALPATGGSGYLGQSSDSWAYQSDGRRFNNNVETNISETATTAGDVVMCAVDMDAGKIWWGVNGTWNESGNPSTGANAQYSNLTGTVRPAVAVYSSSSDLTVNFGQQPFKYDPPA